ncbi:hypothetical protein OIO90_001709 [Microbotryomycetes sp. JL221]|nr:hypothetical protein OIO90_001709 [Microbotryomycetes sp. JL221]
MTSSSSSSNGTAQQSRPLPSPPKYPLLDHTVRTAPMAVISNTATFTALGAVAGSATGIIRNMPAIPSAFSTGVNVGIFSFTFFSMREYLVRPVMIHLDLHPSPLPSSSTSSPSWLSPHTHNLAPSFISGVGAGTVFHMFVRGVKGSVKAGFTLGLGCTVVQAIVNEADIVRIKVLASLERQQQLRNQHRPATAHESNDASLATTSAVTSQVTTATPSAEFTSLSDKVKATHSFDTSVRPTFSEQSDKLFASAADWVKRKLTSISPVTALSQEEYVARLEKQLDKVEKQRSEVAKELEALERANGR